MVRLFKVSPTGRQVFFWDFLFNFLQQMLQITSVIVSHVCFGDIQANYDHGSSSSLSVWPNR